MYPRLEFRNPVYRPYGLHLTPPGRFPHPFLLSFPIEKESFPPSPPLLVVLDWPSARRRFSSVGRPSSGPVSQGPPRGSREGGVLRPRCRRREEEFHRRRLLNFRRVGTLSRSCGSGGSGRHWTEGIQNREGGPVSLRLLTLNPRTSTFLLVL